MEVKEIAFDVEKISTMHKVTKELISEVDVSVGQASDDFFTDMLTVRMDAYILSNLSETRTLTHYTPRPKFLDWLLRRSKKLEWQLDVKDIMLNPPKLKDKTSRIYMVNKL